MGVNNGLHDKQSLSTHTPRLDAERVAGMNGVGLQGLQGKVVRLRQNALAEIPPKFALFQL